MSKEPDQNQEHTFLGIDLCSWFKNSGNCCFGDRDDRSVSDGGFKPPIKSGTEKRKKIKGNMDVEERTSVLDGEGGLADYKSDFDWHDLEETILPYDPNYIHHDPNGNAHELAENPQEFVDIEDLKRNVPGRKDDDIHSELSHNSKRIKKNKTRAPKPAAPKKSSDDDEPNHQGGGKSRNKRRPWQPHEDEKVLQLVAKYGPCWAQISSLMDGRTGKQIRDRYLNKLRPNIKKGDWTPQEDLALISIYKKVGHKWSKIATYLPGRTEGQVKNRFYSHIKKKILHEADDGISPEQSSPDQSSPPYPTSSNENIASNVNTTSYGNSPTSQYQANPQSGFAHNKNTTPNGFQNIHPIKVEMSDPSHFISYSTDQNGANNFAHTANGNTAGNGIYYQTQNGFSESDHSTDGYFSTQKPGEKDNLFELLSTIPESSNKNDSQSVSGSESDLSQADKLHKMEELKKRKAQLEYLLGRTMQEINNYDPVAVQNGNMFHA